MRKPPVLLAWLVFSLVVMFTMSVEAYEFFEDEVKWPSPAATFRVDISGADGLWNTAFETAMAHWNDATIFEFGIVRDTFEDPCDGLPNLISKGDYENGVAFTDDICGDAFGAETLAYMRAWTIEDSTITQANIFFNKAVDWDVHGEVHDGNVFGPTAAKDFRRVAVHELGHALGLDHEDDVPAIMYPDYSGIQVLVTPQCDDIAGVRALYQNEDEDWPCPINYSSSDATWISGPSGRVTGSNVNATDQTDEPAALGSRSVWWEWRAPSDGTLTVDTAGSSFDTTLGVYELTYVYAAFDKTRLAENDDAAGNQSRVTLYVTEGKPYMLRVAGYGGATGDIVLNWDLSQAPPQSSESESFSIPNLGGWSVTSDGTEAATKMGYGRIRAAAGSTTPSGIAIFGLRQGGVLVSEAGVPATEAVREGRIFAEVNGPVNTGLAIANPNDAPATIDFYFTDTGGNRFGEGRYELRAHEQTATFLNQPPFNSGSPVLGTFTFTSSLPIAVVALRGLTNQADEFLMTTLPVAPLSSAATDTVYFPHFADGSGWATEVILVNPTDATITGTVRFLGPGSGAMTASRATLTLDDGRTGSDFAYSIPPRSSQKFTTSNPSRPVSSGSVRAIPNQGSAAPSGLVVFSYTTPGGKTVSESGVSALPAGSAFRVYAELSGTPDRRGSIRTGLAIVNTADTSTTVTLELTELDGTLAAPPATLSLPPSGQVALFLDEIIVSRPGHYSGVLRVTSTADVAIVGLRLRINERGELKMTTTPPSEETGASTTADRFFPHFVDSAGWSTQFILFSGTAGGASSGTLGFIDPQGAPLDLPVVPTETVSPAEAPDLVVENLPVTNSSPNPGESFTLDATVRNQGNGQSAATTLRIWRSSESTSDTEVRTVAVGSLPASGVSHHAISLTAPTAAENYHYIACVDPVSGESDPWNNCSNAVSVRVIDNSGTGGVNFNLHPANGAPYGITFANDRFYVVDFADLTVYAYTDTGQPNAAAVFALDPANRDPSVITFADGWFYVVDGVEADRNPKVYTYTASGQRYAATDFDLDPINDWPSGITFANDRFYVVDFADLTVYAYTAFGQRYAATDFDLDPINDWPSGITFANGRFYVVDFADLTVYAYTDTGQRDAAFDFPLDPDNDSPTGITVADGWFYVVDNSDDKVYAYTDGPDLVVQNPSPSDSSLTVGESFTLSATVRNQGNRPSVSTILRYYRSSDDAISANYTGVGTDAVGSLLASGSSNESISLTAPSSAGTYYYYACVDPVSGESDPWNNCSNAVPVRVSSGAPDLVVENASVSDSSPNAGASFTLSATVRNQGNRPSVSTILRYYRSLDNAISANDTLVGTDAVWGWSLPASGSSNESISLTAPSSAGTYYYYACVDPVSGETARGNNCSNAVSVRVGDISSGAPDLVVENASVSDSSPNAGASFTLSATVRNQGNAQAAATTLRYYRSLDNAISTDDTGVGTDAVGSLPASGSSDESISLTAPSAAGTYYYGACVDPVSGESARGNNCSDGVLVRVGGTVQPPSSFDLDPANDGAAGITFANGRLYVVDAYDDKVYAYTASGGRDPGADFGLDPANDAAHGITFANNRFYVVDDVDHARHVDDANDKVYAYTASGGRDPDADFEFPLSPQFSGYLGITFANNRFYVVSWYQKAVYGFTASGQRDDSVTFDLAAANDWPAGITFANGSLYVLDAYDDKVYAYTASGGRDPDADFGLDSANDAGQGITFADGRFYVVDETDLKVYTYPLPVN